MQVPPNGQPIIQLAEANTCGGYPKIANVIEAGCGNGRDASFFAQIGRRTIAPVDLRLAVRLYLVGIAYERLVNLSSRLANLRVLLIGELTKKK